MKDLSGIYYHPGSNNLLLLSDKSASLVESTVDGKELSRISLKKSEKTGLHSSIRQAEGITLGFKRDFVCQ